MDYTLVVLDHLRLQLLVQVTLILVMMVVKQLRVVLEQGCELILALITFDFFVLLFVDVRDVVLDDALVGDADFGRQFAQFRDDVFF